MPDRFTSPLHRARAKALRAEMTRAERRLWRHLRAHRLLGESFRRQAPVGPWIVDFLHPRSGLVIEVEDGRHADSPDDAPRDADLAARGLRVLRVRNADVLANLPGVLAAVAAALAAPSPLPGPPPAGGRETPPRPRRALRPGTSKSSAP